MKGLDDIPIYFNQKCCDKSFGRLCPRLQIESRLYDLLMALFTQNKSMIQDTKVTKCYILSNRMRERCSSMSDFIFSNVLVFFFTFQLGKQTPAHSKDGNIIRPQSTPITILKVRNTYSSKLLWWYRGTILRTCPTLLTFLFKHMFQSSRPLAFILYILNSCKLKLI